VQRTKADYEAFELTRVVARRYDPLCRRSKDSQIPDITVQTFGRYKVTRPVETSSIDDQNRPIYHFRVGVVDDQMGEVVREFCASDLDSVRAAVRAVDEMLGWLKNASTNSVF
jgi:hypothetical protein